MMTLNQAINKLQRNIVQLQRLRDVGQRIFKLQTSNIE
jgi:hypothetical protein